MSSEYLNNKFLEDAIFRYHKSQQDQIRYKLIINDIKNSNLKREKHKRKIVYQLIDFENAYNKSTLDYKTSQQELAIAFYTLSEHLTRYAKDIILDADDAIQDCVCTCFEKLHKFNPVKGKAFNYLTTICLNSFRQTYRQHRSYKLLKERFKDFMISNLGNVVIKNGREVYSSED